MKIISGIKNIIGKVGEYKEEYEKRTIARQEKQIASLSNQQKIFTKKAEIQKQKNKLSELKNKNKTSFGSHTTNYLNQSSKENNMGMLAPFPNSFKPEPMFKIKEKEKKY